MATVLEHLLVQSLPKSFIASAYELAAAWEPLYKETNHQEDSPVFDRARKGAEQSRPRDPAT